MKYLNCKRANHDRRTILGASLQVIELCRARRRGVDSLLALRSLLVGEQLRNDLLAILAIMVVVKIAAMSWFRITE
jgi:hypothetical protein